MGFTRSNILLMSKLLELSPLQLNHPKLAPLAVILVRTATAVLLHGSVLEADGAKLKHVSYADERTRSLGTD